MDQNIANVTMEVFKLISPLETSERLKVARAVFALTGDDFLLGQQANGQNARALAPVLPDATGQTLTRVGHQLPARAMSWCSQHKLDQDTLENWFYFNAGKVDVHVNSVPGVSKREQTINCYLLCGLRSFLETDAGRFTDSEAMSLCKHTSVYDKNNHPKFRKALGSLVNGSKEEGFVLTGPGLKEAAELMRKIVA